MLSTEKVPIWINNQLVYGMTLILGEPLGPVFLVEIAFTSNLVDNSFVLGDNCLALNI